MFFYNNEKTEVSAPGDMTPQVAIIQPIYTKNIPIFPVQRICTTGSNLITFIDTFLKN